MLVLGKHLCIAVDASRAGYYNDTTLEHAGSMHLVDCGASTSIFSAPPACLIGASAVSIGVAPSLCSSRTLSACSASQFLLECFPG